MPASTISRSSNMTHPSERWTSAGSMTDLSSINGSSTSASKSGDDHHQHSAHQHRNHLIPPQWLNPTSWNQAVSKSYHSVADPRLMGDDDASVQDWDQPPTVHSSLSDIRQDAQGGQPSSPQTPTSPSTSSAASKQLIAHSSRVQTPQRHHSESVLYLDRERNQRKLYPESSGVIEPAAVGYSNGGRARQRAREAADALHVPGPGEAPSGLRSHSQSHTEEGSAVVLRATPAAPATGLVALGTAIESGKVVVIVAAAAAQSTAPTTATSASTFEREAGFQCIGLRRRQEGKNSQWRIAS
ncbi:unnamed protein product [Trichogramma brassicae]|uniref:Uncharacterized protein n=1 Tax=Trichogramma brassicae TaxID=86971 RepID=A0A6H5I9I6_9HYME|nr:unnamed protein product [Trichogramma brassicae]